MVGDGDTRVAIPGAWRWVGNAVEVAEYGVIVAVAGIIPPLVGVGVRLFAGLRVAVIVAAEPCVGVFSVELGVWVVFKVAVGVFKGVAVDGFRVELGVWVAFKVTVGVFEGVAVAGFDVELGIGVAVALGVEVLLAVTVGVACTRHTSSKVTTCGGVLASPHNQPSTSPLFTV